MLAELDYDNAEKCFYTRGDELISQERDGKKSYYVYDGRRLCEKISVKTINCRKMTLC